MSAQAVSPAKRESAVVSRIAYGVISVLQARLRKRIEDGVFQCARAPGLDERNARALARYQARVRAYQDAQRQKFWPAA